MPASESVDVPNIEKRTGQVISKSSDSVTVMDSENFTNFEVELPNDEETKNALEADKVVEYWIVMDRRVVVKVMSWLSKAFNIDNDQKITKLIHYFFCSASIITKNPIKHGNTSFFSKAVSFLDLLLISA